MKRQFNLDEYNRLVAEGKTPKVVTRDGCEVTILDKNYRTLWDGEPETLVIFKYVHPNGFERLAIVRKDGRTEEEWDTDQDLFFAPEEKECWTIMSKSFDKCTTKEAAESLLTLVDDKEDYIVAHIKWEE